MKQHWKSILAAVFCCALLLNGCGETTSNVPETEKETENDKDSSKTADSAIAPGNYDEHFDIDLMSYFVMDVSPEDDIIQYLNDKFNVTIKPTITNLSNYASTLEMKISANETPDWFRVNDGKMVSQIVDDGLAVNVSEYVQKYNFKNIQAAFDRPLAHLLKRNGAFYCVPDYTGHLVTGIYVRKDWMDELNLSQPKTWEDFKKVLQAMVDKDPDGNGTTGITTYEYAGEHKHFTSCWLGYNDWGYVNDQLNYYATDPNFKNFVKYWNDLYENHLLDPEIFDNTYEEAMKKFDTGRAGVLTMNLVQLWWDANEGPMKEYDPDSEMMAFVPIPEGPQGSHVRHNLPYYADSYFSSKMSEAKRVRVLEIMDYLLGEEGRELTLYGFEGKQHTVENGKKIQNTDVVTKEWGQSIHLMGELANFGASQDLTTSKWCQDYIDWLDTPGNASYNYASFFNNEETVSLYANINEVFQTYFVPFITGEKDIDAEWDAYIDAMNKAGVTELTALTDEYLKSNGYDADMPHITK